MNPSGGGPAPGYLDRLMQFLFGQGALNQAAGGQPSPPPVAQNFLQPQSSKIFPDNSQNNTQMQGIVNAYMQQRAAADAAKKTKKKVKQPILEED